MYWAPQISGPFYLRRRTLNQNSESSKRTQPRSVPTASLALFISAASRAERIATELLWCSKIVSQHGVVWTDEVRVRTKDDVQYCFAPWCVNLVYLVLWRWLSHQAARRSSQYLPNWVSCALLSNSIAWILRHYHCSALDYDHDIIVVWLHQNFGHHYWIFIDIYLGR